MVGDSISRLDPTTVQNSSDFIISYLIRQGKPVSHKILREQSKLDKNRLSEVLGSLVSQNRVALINDGNDVLVKLANSGLSGNAQLVYQEVERGGSSGVDQASLSSKLRIPKAEVAKALHTLVDLRYIQERRSFTNKAKKIYLLVGVEPSDQVTGGAFYCGEELDVNFVDNLRCLIVSFVFQKSSVSMLDIQHFFKTVRDVSGHAASSSSSLHECASSPVSVVSSSTAEGLSFSHPTGPRSPSSFSTEQTAQRRHQQVYAAASSLASKVISDSDVEKLTRSLVLDGVLVEKMGSGVHHGIVTYTIATGKNVMRHFSAMPRSHHQDMEDFGKGESIGAKRSRSLRSSSESTPHETSAMRLLRHGLQRSGRMVPAPISQCAAGALDESDWSYMPAVGFPCLGCPQLHVCGAGSVVNPMECLYLEEWQK